MCVSVREEERVCNNILCLKLRAQRYMNLDHQQWTPFVPVNNVYAVTTTFFGWVYMYIIHGLGDIFTEHFCI